MPEHAPAAECRICSRCILPESFPGITFDEDGVCNHCRKALGRGTGPEDERKAYGKKFFELLLAQLEEEDGQRSRPYDVLMAYSGGKDSTYTMSLLKNRYKLRVLALSFDNGFLSGTAVANIRKTTDHLGVDHILFKPQWELLKKIFRTAAEQELYSRKSLERASTICTSCMGIVKSMCLKVSIEMNIPMIAYGWSPGQAPVQSSIMKNNPSFVRTAQQAVLDPLRKIAGGAVSAYFLREEHFSAPERFPYNIHPMAWEYYNEQMILNEIRAFGWTAPEDTDTNSTNCLLNALANDIHLKRYRFHPYAWEIANMVREGIMCREEGYRKIYSDQPTEMIGLARERLGMPNCALRA